MNLIWLFIKNVHLTTYFLFLVSFTFIFISYLGWKEHPMLGVITGLQCFGLFFFAFSALEEDIITFNIIKQQFNS